MQVKSAELVRLPVIQSDRSHYVPHSDQSDPSAAKAQWSHYNAGAVDDEMNHLHNYHAQLGTGQANQFGNAVAAEPSNSSVMGTGTHGYAYNATVESVYSSSSSSSCSSTTSSLSSMNHNQAMKASHLNHHHHPQYVNTVAYPYDTTVEHLDRMLFVGCPRLAERDEGLAELKNTEHLSSADHHHRHHHSMTMNHDTETPDDHYHDHSRYENLYQSNLDTYAKPTQSHHYVQDLYHAPAASLTSGQHASYTYPLGQQNAHEFCPIDYPYNPAPPPPPPPPQYVGYPDDQYDDQLYVVKHADGQFLHKS